MATRTQQRSPNPQETTTSHSNNNSPFTPEFTPEMRDRQARGKTVDEWDLQNGSSSSSSAKEGFHDREKKELAMRVLDCPEKMLMYAQGEDDSIAGQRVRFLRFLHCSGEEREGRGGEERRSSRR